jgi:hypothetical protein
MTIFGIKAILVLGYNKPENAFLVIGRGDAMRERFGDIMAPTQLKQYLYWV